MQVQMNSHLQFCKADTFHLPTQEQIFFKPPENEMQIRYELNSPVKTHSLLRKLVTLTVTVAMLGLVLMFSALLLVIITIVGALAWAYLWWKTRELRKQMRDFVPREAERENKESDVEIFEGEVIRVVDTKNEQ
jgi:hypothetical protein